MRHFTHSYIKGEQGVSLLLTIILTTTLLTIGVATLVMIDSGLSDTYSLNDEIKAMYLAETGIHEALWYLDNVNSSWSGDSPTEHSYGDGTYTISIAGSTVTAVGYVPNIASERSHKTLTAQYSAGGGGGVTPDGQYSHGDSYLSITNTGGTETTAFSTNEDVIVKYTTSNNCNWGKITVRTYDGNKIVNGAMMTETDNGDGTWSYTYTIDTNADLSGVADWYYIQVETNTPKEKPKAHIVTGTPGTPHYFKTYSDAGYSTESDEFAMDATIYVEVFGDDGNPDSNDSKLKLYDYPDNKVIDEDPQNLTKQASNTYRFTVNLMNAEPLVAGWHYSLETEMKNGGTTYFKGTKQIKILAPATITVTGQYSEGIRGLEITNGTTQKTAFTTGETITINYTTAGNCDTAKLKVEDYNGNNIINNKDMTATDNGNGTCTYSYSFDDTDLSGADWYYYKVDVNTPDEKPLGLFSLDGGAHYFKTYSDAAYTTESDEFEVGSTLYLEVYGDNGTPTLSKSDVELKDYADDKKINSTPNTLTIQAANTYRMSVDLSAPDSPLSAGFWYSLKVKAKSASTTFFEGTKQIKIIAAAVGSPSVTTWTEVY